jgi:ABC-type bacteriocin/lantibiotic exporter with double-glycine peptidase domain
MVRAFTSEKNNYKRFVERVSEVQHLRWKESLLSITSNSINNYLISVWILVCLSAGGWHVGQGIMSLGMLMAFIKLLMDLTSPIKDLMSRTIQAQSALASAERYFLLLDKKEESNNNKLFDSNVNHVNLQDIWYNNGYISLNSVSFSYNTEENNLLSNISFTLTRGTKLVISGDNGSGKSTIVKLILAFYKPVKGEIKLNDINIDNFKKNEWRDLFSYVPQDPYIIKGTIKDNLLYGNSNATDEDLDHVLKITGLNHSLQIDKDLLTMDVGERGNKLSGGQKQRISLARALLKDAPIFILDELDAALDQEIKKEIRDLLTSNYFANKTLILISHDVEFINTDWRTLDLSIESSLKKESRLLI